MCVYVMDSQTVIKTLIFNPPHQNNPTFKHTSLSTQQNYDTEISIFDAHKYFNNIKPDQTVRRNSFRRTTTPSSEASWNSLLPNPSNNVSANYSSKWISSAKKWLFRTKCCCNTEKSVQVKQLNSDSKHNESVVMIETKKTSENIVEIHHIKAMAVVSAPRQQRISASARSFIDGAVGFTFPILNSNSPNGIEDTSSDGFPANYKVESMDNCSDDDVGSEASSDLFEIESFSTQTASSNEIDDVQQGRRSVEAERECFPSGLTPLAVQAGGRPPQAKAWPLGSSHSGAIGSSITYDAVFSTTVI